MSTNIQAIAPLWESFPGTKVQGTEKAQGGSMFADIFKSAVARDLDAGLVITDPIGEVFAQL